MKSLGEANKFVDTMIEQLMHSRFHVKLVEIIKLYSLFESFESLVKITKN